MSFQQEKYYVRSLSAAQKAVAAFDEAKGEEEHEAAWHAKDKALEQANRDFMGLLGLTIKEKWREANE